MKLKRNEKYKCKHCKDEWLEMTSENYCCPSCGLLYQEVSTKAKEYIGIFPISDTIIVEQ